MEAFIEGIDSGASVIIVTFTDSEDRDISRRLAVPFPDTPVATEEEFAAHISKYAPHAQFAIDKENKSKVAAGTYDNLADFVGGTYTCNPPVAGDDTVY